MNNQLKDYLTPSEYIHYDNKGMKKNQLGEIATILTLSTLIIIGLSSLASSFFLKNRQTTASKAVEACTDYETESEAKAGCDPQGFEPVPGTPSCYRCKTTSSSTTNITSASGKCECSGGSAFGPCGDTNPCGPVPNKDSSAPNGDPKCSTYGDWSNVCAGTNENCPSDAGVTYTYWCDGKDWRFQYPNCVTWCKKEYIEKPPSNIDDLCKDGSKQKSAGTVITEEFKKSGRSLPKPQVEEVGGQLVACDGNQGVYVEMNAFCDQFGQVQWGPGAKTNKICAPPEVNITKTPSGKFWLTANVEVKKEDKGIKFDTTVVFNSTDCDGDITLYRNGGLVAGPNRWNSGGKSSFIFEYYPQWTGSVTLGSGGKETASYHGRVDNCPRSKVTLEDTINCEFGVSPYGIPWVRGTGCSLKNFSDVQKITPATTPVVKKQPTWAPPPPPKLNTTPIIFKPVSKTTTSTTVPTGKKDGTEGATCGRELGGCKDGLECKQIPLGYGYGICEKSPSSSGTTITTTPSLSSVPTNRCPDNGKDVSCQISCGSGFVEVDRPCITIWDKCCVKKNTAQNQDLLTPLPTRTETRTFEFDLGPGSVGQAFNQWVLNNLQICDYFGTTFGVLNDVRNCKVPPDINRKQNEDKYLITYEVKPNQKQMLCEMNGAGIPTKCLPLDQFKIKQ